MKVIIKIISLSLFFALLVSLSTFASEWKQSDTGWWYQNDDGSYPTNAWIWIDGNSDGISECYYFDSNGYLLTNTTTPDGYTVNQDGAWMLNGEIQQIGVKAKTLTSSQFSASDLSGTWVRQYYVNTAGGYYTSPDVELIISPKSNGTYEFAYYVSNNGTRFRSMFEEFTPAQDGTFTLNSSSGGINLGTSKYVLASKNEMYSYQDTSATIITSYFIKK